MQQSAALCTLGAAWPGGVTVAMLQPRQHQLANAGAAVLRVACPSGVTVAMLQPRATSVGQRSGAAVLRVACPSGGTVTDFTPPSHGVQRLPADAVGAASELTAKGWLMLLAHTAPCRKWVARRLSRVPPPPPFVHHQHVEVATPACKQTDDAMFEEALHDGAPVPCAALPACKYVGLAFESSAAVIGPARIVCRASRAGGGPCMDAGTRLVETGRH